MKVKEIFGRSGVEAIASMAVKARMGTPGGGGMMPMPGPGPTGIVATTVFVAVSIT
jgi:hypothetical protein